MNERERIIELVKKGILTTEEGLDLIEGLANKENKQTSHRDFGQEAVKLKNNAVDYFKSMMEPKKETTIEEAPTIESIVLEEEMDELTADIIKLEEQIENQNEKLNQLAINQLHLDIETLNEERRLIKEMDEVDHRDEVKMIDREIKEKEQDLAEAKRQKEVILNRVHKLNEDLTEKSKAYNECLKAYKKETNANKHNYKDDLKAQFQFSDDWKQEASDKVNQTGKEVNRVFKDVVDSSKAFLNNFEWKKQEFKVPTIASQTFETKWTVEDYKPTILDIKNANGLVAIESADVESIEIQADVTMYGKFDKPLEEALNDRMEYKVDEDRLVFQIPNKRVKVDLHIQLPRDTYDYLSLNVLNGDIELKDLKLNDLLVKVVNGGVTFDSVKATMAEVKGSSTNSTLRNVDLQDLIINTVNGEITLQGDIISSSVSSTNGQIRATLTSNEMVQFEGTTVNGDVKVSLPASRDLEVEGKTTFGKVYSRLTDTTIVKENDELTDVQYARDEKGDAIRVKAKTARGNILLKDTK